MSVLDLLKFIPDVVWSGIIASLLTLSGVLISNKSNTARLRMQLNHDAEQKERDRKATIRREVYIRAAEELVKANTHLVPSRKLISLKPISFRASKAFSLRRPNWRSSRSCRRLI